MGDADGRLGLIDVLTTGAGGAVCVDLQILGINGELHLFRFGHDGHGGGRGLDAAGGLCFRYPLYPVRARFKFQPRESSRALHGGHGLFNAAKLRFVEGYHVQREAAALGIHGVHPQEIGGKQRALFAADTGPDFQHDILFIIGVAGQQQALQLLLQPIPLCLGGHQLFLTQLAQLRIGQHFRSSGNIGLSLGVSAVSLRHRRQLLLLAAQLCHCLTVGIHRGVRKLALDLGQAMGDFFQLIQHGRSPDTAARRR